MLPAEGGPLSPWLRAKVWARCSRGGGQSVVNPKQLGGGRGPWQGLDEQITGWRVLRCMPPLTPASHSRNWRQEKYLAPKCNVTQGNHACEAIRKSCNGESPLAKDASLDLSIALLAMTGREDSAEGLFLPETWSYTRGDSDLDILRRAHSR
jgi:hypothetical protein